MSQIRDRGEHRLEEIQADLSQILDAPSRQQGVMVSLPMGSVFLRQAVGGQQGQDYDVLRVNEHGATCWREVMIRPELRAIVEGADYHETMIHIGPWEQVWPSRYSNGGGFR